MKISEAWLKDVVGDQLKSINIEHVLTQLGLEVEKIESVGNYSHNNLVCCFVQKTQKHPEMDKLKFVWSKLVQTRISLWFVEPKTCLRVPRRF